MQIREMGLSTRTENALRCNGIHQVEDLGKLSLSQLLSLPGIGMRAVEEIQSKGKPRPNPHAMSKQQLSQFLCLKKEAESYRKKLRELDKLPPGDPKQLEAIRKQYEQACSRCLAEIQQIEAFLQSIPDSRLRLIFAKRYLEGKSWQAVAFAIGHYDEQYPRKLHNRYLNL